MNRITVGSSFSRAVVAGAKAVFGLAAVKTLGNSDNLPNVPKPVSGEASSPAQPYDDDITF